MLFFGKFSYYNLLVLINNRAISVIIYRTRSGGLEKNIGRAFIRQNGTFKFKEEDKNEEIETTEKTHFEKWHSA